MSRSYGIKKDFGLHNQVGVFLPDPHEGYVASPSKSTASYRSTMPAYDVRQQQRGKGQLSISGGKERKDRAALRQSDDVARDQSECPRAKEGQDKRSWFGGRKKTKKTRDPPSSSVIDEIALGKDVTRSSPMLQVRSATRGGEKDQFGRPQTDPEEPRDEEARMQVSYDAPVDVTKSAPELIRLTLQPGKESSHTSLLQVTLRKRGQGFGLHLSTGLPPVTVTYVEPGGDAEAAGVSVGDQVVEVNGEECETVRDATKIVALKLMIQQTAIREVSEGEIEAETSSGLNDTTWNKIQARQHQDDVESHHSSNVELTQIDGDSDVENNVLEKFRKKATKQSPTETVQISTTEWECMREQRELLFHKNAPSTLLQEKGRKKEEGDEAVLQKSPEHSAKQQSSGGRATGGVASPEKRTPDKSKASGGGGGWFKRKKKEKSGELNTSDTGATTEEVVEKEREKAAAKKGHRSKKTGGGEAKRNPRSKQTTSLQKSPVRGATSRQTADGKHQKTPKRGGGATMKVTSIDNLEIEEERHPPGENVRDHVRKTFSYEGALLPPDAGRVTTSLPRSRSHNAMFRATLIQAVQQQQQQKHNTLTGSSLEAPIIAHRRSKSYEGEVEEEGGMPIAGGALSQNEYLEAATLSVETRSTSRSHSDISGLEAEERIEPNLRLKKSGIVKESSNWRPTLEVFGGKESRAKCDVKLTQTDTESTDGPASQDEPSTTGNDSKKATGSVDLGAVPRTTPSLGQHPGRARRDLVARSSVKRRLPTNRGALLFKADEAQKMGIKRVELSEFSSTHRTRAHTMPEKMSRKVIEAAPVTSSLNEHSRDHSKPSKSRGVSRNLFKEPQQHDSGNSLQRPIRERDRAGSFNNLQRQLSNTSTGSSADMVTRAVAAKKRLSSMTLEEEVEKIPREVQREGVEEERVSLLGGSAGSAILAQLRQEKRAERDKYEETTGKQNERQEAAKEKVIEGTEKKITGVEEKIEVTAEAGKEKAEVVQEGFTNDEVERAKEVKDRVEFVKEKGKDEEIQGNNVGQKDREKSPVKEEEQEKAASRSRRRNKTVEKPVKSLGIASDPQPATPDQTPPPQTMVTLRKTPSSELKPVSSSYSSTTPSWVTMAEKKKQRVSALLMRDSSAEAQSPPPEVSPPSLSPTSPPVTKPTSTKPTSSAVTKPTSPPITKPTSPPVTIPTSPTHVTKPTSPTHVTKPTSPTHVTKPTSPPITKPTSPPVFKPPVTSPTSPTHVTKPTSPTHVTKPTFPPITKPTSPPVTIPTSPTHVTKPTSPTHITKPTSPTHVTKPTSPTHVTKPTFPPITKPTSPPVTSPTSPTHVTKPTSPTHVTKPTFPPITKPTSPPVTIPTSPTHVTKPTSPTHITKPTSPTHVTKPTSPPITIPTSPTHVTKPTSPTHITKPTSPTHVTKPTSPTHVTKPTSPPITKPTSPPVSKPPVTSPTSPTHVTKPTSPTHVTTPTSPTHVTKPTSPPLTKPTTTPNTTPPKDTVNPTDPVSQESGIPRKGTVRSRMALFQ